MNVKKEACRIFSHNEEDFVRCMENPLRFVAERSVKVVVTSVINLGVQKIIAMLPEMVV